MLLGLESDLPKLQPDIADWCWCIRLPPAMHCWSHIAARSSNHAYCCHVSLAVKCLGNYRFTSVVFWLCNRVQQWQLFVVVCRHVFQGVHMLLQFASSKDGAGRPWAADEPRLNKLVFIGKNLNRKELTDSFAACLAAK